MGAGYCFLGLGWGTIWPARLTAKYVRITEEISRAIAESVKQALNLAKLNDKAAGQVLLVEARRVRSELGPSPTDDVPDTWTRDRRLVA